MTKPTRTKEQIAADFAPLTAARHHQATALKVAMWDRLSKGLHLAPHPDEYTLAHRDQMHDAFVLVSRRVDHLEDKLRHHEREIGTGIKLSEEERALLIKVLGTVDGDVAKELHARIARTTQPPPEPPKAPDPLEPREQAIAELVTGGMTLGAAVAQIDAKGAR